MIDKKKQLSSNTNCRGGGGLGTEMSSPGIDGCWLKFNSYESFVYININETFNKYLVAGILGQFPIEIHKTQNRFLFTYFLFRVSIP